MMYNWYSGERGQLDIFCILKVFMVEGPQNQLNRKKCFAFVRKYLSKLLSIWEKFIFSNESEFNLFVCDGRNRYKSELKKQNIFVIVKLEGHIIVLRRFHTSKQEILCFLIAMLYQHFAPEPA